MKKSIHIIIASLLIAGVGFSIPVSADETMSHRHSMNMTKNNNGTQGKLIHEKKTAGYSFEYRLIDMEASMPGMSHLMITVTDSKGKTVEKAAVTYQIKGPDENDQNVTAMAMGSGYGGNVHLPAPGSYEIKATVVFGKKTATDSFTYKKTN